MNGSDMELPTSGTFPTQFLPARLVCISGSAQGTVRQDWGDTLTIGRGASCDIVLNEDSISKVHARIRLRNGQYYLEDPGSSNGTFLQGRKISYEKLQNGHIIRMGRTSFRFEQELPTTQKLPPPNRLVYFLSAGIAFVIIAIALLIWKLG